MKIELSDDVSAPAAFGTVLLKSFELALSVLWQKLGPVNAFPLLVKD